MIGWLSLGAVLAAAFLAAGLRLDARSQRGLWALGLVVAALLHVGFALGDGLGAVAVQLVGVGLFAAAARLGVAGRPGWLAAGWLLHPLWDVAFGGTAPEWYVWACVAFDLVVGAALYLRAVRR